MQTDQQVRQAFLETLWNHYRTHGRQLPWRDAEPNGTYDPYKVLVSELMLQQTQVQRVIPKYEAFLHTFPDAEALAQANLGDVLRAWQGLGYNRRAKFLWQAARQITDHGGMPRTMEGLKALPGIGVNTAGAILAYAYNEPAIFIETNVRTVYIHHFFEDSDAVTDARIRLVLEDTLDREHPREFYWGLMDYGTYLKSEVGNVSKRSRHYVPQSAFAGSKRQIRGAVLRSLSERPLSADELATQCPDGRLAQVLGDLEREGMIRLDGTHYCL